MDSSSRSSPTSRSVTPTDQAQQQAQQQVQTSQASIVPSGIGSLIPVLAIGGVAYLIAKKAKVI